MDQWTQRQQASVARYLDGTYEEDPTIGQMFGNFIATGLADRSGTVIDIGCGLFPTLPHYVAQLGLSGYIGIEPLTTTVKRSYECLVGVMAEKLPMESASVNAALFATSLDHIADVDAAIAEVSRVLKPDGAFFIWQGLYDPIMVARQKTFAPSMAYGFPVGVAYVTIEALLTWKRMRLRTRQLKKGRRIDAAHERWYTKESLLADIGRWGLTVTRQLQPPGTSSIFIEARAHCPPNP